MLLHFQHITNENAVKNNQGKNHETNTH